MNNKVKNIIILTMIIISIYLSIQLFDDVITIIKIIFNILSPIIFGFAIAFLLNPLKQRLLKKKVSNGFSTILLVTLFICLIMGIFLLVLPNLINEMTEFLEKMPLYVEKIQKIYNEYLNKYHIKDTFNGVFIEIINNLTEKIMNFLQTIISYSFNFFIGVFLSFYLLYDFDKIIDFLKKITNQTKYLNVRLFLKEFKESIYLYFIGIIQSNFILFLLAVILFAIIKIKNVIPIALILSITNIIPYLGPYIGGAFAIIVGLNSSNRLAMLIFFIIVVLQFIDNYIVSPKIQSKKNEIKPVFVIISIIIMGSIFGIIGMVLAVPMILFIRTFNKYFGIHKTKKLKNNY